LRAMAKRTRVVISTVGPYPEFGHNLVQACAMEGTHYADLSGDSFFQRDVIDQHHATARESGAILVLGAGFNSLPFDIGAHLARRALGSGTEPVEISSVLTDAKGYVSGGTLFAALAMLQANVPEKWHTDPYLLVPRTRCPVDTDITGWGGLPRYDAVASTLGLPYPAGSTNAQLVRRSFMLNGFGHTSYAEGAGLFTLYSSAWWLASSWLFGDLILAPVRGDGQPESVQNGGSFEAWTTAATQSGDRKATVHIVGKGDFGSLHPARLLAEVGLCLADETCRHPDTYGVLTPASALQTEEIVKRLSASTHDGQPLLAFEVSTNTEGHQNSKPDL